MKKIMFTAILFCIAGQLKLKAQAMAAVHESIRYIYAEEGAVQLKQPTNEATEKTYVGSYFMAPILTKPVSPNGSGVDETYSQMASIKAIKAQVFGKDEETNLSLEKSSVTRQELVAVNMNVR